MRKRIRNIIGRIPEHQRIEPDYMRGMVRDQIGQYIFTKTKRRPMILPVVIEV